MLGGPHADAGLTGRKIIVDTYGGMARHGGGAFSRQGPVQGRPLGRLRRPLGGQERRRRPAPPTRCEVQVAYAIGVAQPVSLLVETFGTDDGRPEARSTRPSREVFDLRPAAIVRDLDLRRPIYQQTAAYGHFGRTGDGLHLGAHRPGRRPEVGARALTQPSRSCDGTVARPPTHARAASVRVVRVLPDVPAIDKDVRLPGPGAARGPGARRARWCASPLHGRRVGGWVGRARRRAAAPASSSTPLAKVTGWGRRPS